MKMIAISTTENIVDSNNLNLSGQTVIRMIPEMQTGMNNHKSFKFALSEK